MCNCNEVMRQNKVLGDKIEAKIKTIRMLNETVYERDTYIDSLITENQELKKNAYDRDLEISTLRGYPQLKKQQDVDKEEIMDAEYTVSDKHKVTMDELIENVQLVRELFVKLDLKRNKHFLLVVDRAYGLETALTIYKLAEGI